jgi:hypothetical protein
MSDTDKERALSQFQQKSAESKSAVVGEGEQYEAFKVVDRRQLSLHVRPVGEPLLILKYSYMLYAIAAPSGRRLDLTFSFMLVTIKGRNLHALADAIGDERCAYLQQFDPATWPALKDESAPLIESIHYVMNLPMETEKRTEAR